MLSTLCCAPQQSQYIFINEANRSESCGYVGSGRLSSVVVCGWECINNRGTIFHCVACLVSVHNLCQTWIWVFSGIHKTLSTNKMGNLLVHSTSRTLLFGPCHKPHRTSATVQDVKGTEKKRAGIIILVQQRDTTPENTLNCDIGHDTVSHLAEIKVIEIAMPPL